MIPAVKSLAAVYRSSIGKKLIVALTGLVLIGFLLGHVIGNLKVFFGAEKLNAYGAFLHSMPAFLWAFRITILVCLVVHVVTTITLVLQNRAARGDTRYAYGATVKATSASRTMAISGLTILAFVIYHILHFTARVGNDYNSYVDAKGRHDVYKMVIDGFSWFPASAFYIVAMALLCWHLCHGFASVFQTLGLRSQRSWPIIRCAGYAFAAFIFIGSVSVPIAVMAGWVTY